MAVILITGAGSGIGLALSTLYAARGSKVYAALRTLDNYPNELNHPNIRLLQLDVTKSDDIQAAFIKMSGYFGLPDMLINNAGINMPSIIEETSDTVWEKIFAVNFLAPLQLCQKLLPTMRKAGHGTIVMISSLSAEVALPGDGPYAASKAALTRAAEALHYEVAPFGIKVITLEPGAVKSNLNQMPGIPEKALSVYDPLRAHLQKRAGEKTGGVETKDIALEMISLIDAPDSPAVCPVGKQAQGIMQKLNNASAKDRAQLIRAASGL